jgi:hypothetical protein
MQEIDRGGRFERILRVIEHNTMPFTRLQSAFKRRAFMNKCLLGIIGGVVLIVGSRTEAQANEVTDWNEMLFRASVVASASPLNMSRNSALVEAAVFDAVNGIEKRYTPIHVDPAGPANASRRAAAVQAAYAILVRLYGFNGVFAPNQQPTLDARRTASLTDIEADESAAAVASGIAWGQTVADAIWAWRSTDGFSLAAPTWTGSALLGQWRPTPNVPYPGTSTNGVGYPQFSSMVPWAIVSPSQFRPAGPPALTSAQYARDFNETKSKGSLTSATRTPDETNAAWFWQIGTAAYLWNHVAVSLVHRRDDDRGKRHDDSDRWDDDRDDHPSRHTQHALLEDARLLAALDVAMADAAIGCWDAKYAYNFWRPITAIRETADDHNDATVPDPSFTPLFATPAHPDYPSGHSCVSGAAVGVLAREFGPNVHFQMQTDLLVGVIRSFHGFADALEEMKDARINAGIHFRTATEDGTTLGAAVAEYVLGQKFQRVH